VAAEKRSGKADTVATPQSEETRMVVSENGEWLEGRPYPAGARWPYPHRSDGAEDPHYGTTETPQPPYANNDINSRTNTRVYETGETDSFPSRRGVSRGKPRQFPNGGVSIPGASHLRSDQEQVSSPESRTDNKESMSIKPTSTPRDNRGRFSRGLAQGHPDLTQHNTSASQVLAHLHTVRGNTLDLGVADTTAGGFSHAGEATLHSHDFASQAGSYTGMQDVNHSPARPDFHQARTQQSNGTHSLSEPCYPGTGAMDFSTPGRQATVSDHGHASGDAFTAENPAPAPRALDTAQAPRSGDGAGKFVSQLRARGLNVTPVDLSACSA
jgi:hypothetical protein